MIRKQIFQNILPASKSDYIVQRKRNGFYKPEPSTRKVDFDGLEAVDVQQNGSLVQLGPSSLEKLLHVKVLDPTDLSYKQEGRPQRTISKEVNLGQSSLDLKSELSAIKEALIQNVASDNHGITALTLALNNVLNRPRVTNEISRQELLNIIIPAIQELDLPSGKQYSKVLDNRFFTRQMYNGSRGLVNIFLLNNRPSETPIIIMRTANETGQLAPLSYLENSWNDARILDVETGTLMPPALANDLIRFNALDKDIKGQVGPYGKILFPENYDPSTVPTYNPPINFQGNVNLLPLPPAPNAPPAPPAPTASHASTPKPPKPPSSAGPSSGPRPGAISSLAEEASKNATLRANIRNVVDNLMGNPMLNILESRVQNDLNWIGSVINQKLNMRLLVMYYMVNNKSFGLDATNDTMKFLKFLNVTNKVIKNISVNDFQKIFWKLKDIEKEFKKFDSQLFNVNVQGHGMKLNMTRNRASRKQVGMGSKRYSIGDYRSPLKLMY